MFNMTALALRTSASVNGVSKLHGEVTKQMWQSIWPGTSYDALPVRSVTNGVHVPTWISSEIEALFEEYLGPDWIERHDDPALVERVLSIPDEKLWSACQTLRSYLLNFVRERARQKWSAQAAASRVVAAGTMFDQNTLTIGFARRFTSYKRLELIYRTTLDPKFGGRIAFVDDYDLHVAHFLVQGCDVWLNNPRKPLEASGTSGMKASINGVPHFSIGDGWWAEGFNGTNGWVIDGGTNGQNPDETDAAADALYRLLEEEVVPAFYDREPAKAPRRWAAMVKESIRSVAPRFSARR